MFLLDTSIVSDVQRRMPKPSLWLSSTEPHQIYLSVITIGEIERGIEAIRISDSARSAKLSAWLRDIVGESADRILPVTQSVSLVWGRISAKRRIGDADGLIAATAVVHDLVVVTRNVSDFSETGVKLLNPWEL